MLLYDDQNGTLGPGVAGNVTVPFTVPYGSSAASLTGNLSITGCAVPGGDCLAYAAIYTPTNWVNYQHNRPAMVVWCFNPGTGMCTPAQYTPINGTDDLAPYAGSVLDLCLWNNATVGSQMFMADATLHYTVTTYHT